MGFFKVMWGRGKSPETVSREDFTRTIVEYDRHLEELDEAVHALRGDPEEGEDARQRERG
jgi:hypothetical protein